MSIHTAHTYLGLTDAEIAAVRAPLESAALLPAKVYSDRDIFSLERERIFQKGWLPVCHVSQISSPGDYVARNLLGEAVLAVRGRDGEIRVMSNVCRHRNMVLTSGSGSCKGNRVICPYHGWTYGMDGKLLAAPFMEEAKGFARRDIQLTQFRHETWHGFLFVNFDQNARPLGEQLAGLEPDVAPYRMEDMEAFELRRYTVPWNWKISLENFSEAYHQPWVHAETAEYAYPAKDGIYKNSTGPYSVFLLYQKSGTDFPTFSPPVEGLPNPLRRAVTVFNVYPYFHVLTDAANPLVLDFNIKSEREHELVWTLLMPKGSREQPGIQERLAEYRDFIIPIHDQDTGVCTGVSEGVASRFTEQGRLSHMERAVHQFHNTWLDWMVESELADADAV